MKTNNQNKGRSGREQTNRSRSRGKSNESGSYGTSRPSRSKPYGKNNDADFSEDKTFAGKSKDNSGKRGGTATGRSNDYTGKRSSYTGRRNDNAGTEGGNDFEGRHNNSYSGKRGGTATGRSNDYAGKRSSYAGKRGDNTATGRSNNYAGKRKEFTRNENYGGKRDEGLEQKDNSYNPNAKYSRKKQIEYRKRQGLEQGEIRLNRFLANAGICSRREADEYIKAGVVTVNGNIVTEMGTRVSKSDKVMFHDQLVRSEKKVYILVNKPKDCVTTSDDPQERFTVMDLIKDACSERVYPVGRLDRNTTGVLLLTNDGDLAARLTHPKYNKKKIYHVFLDKPLTKQHMQDIADGIQLEDGEIHADKISYADEADKKQVGIEIHSGRNRIVRRIFEHFGYKVEKLDRVYFAGLTKKNLSRGRFRFLTEKEINMLNMGAFE